MNIGRIARNQQMMYNFVNRGNNQGYGAQMQTQFSAFGSWGVSGTGTGSNSTDLREKMGLSGLKGSTVREMARNQLNVRTNETGSAAETAQTYTGLNSSAAQAYTGLNSAAVKYAGLSQRTIPISSEMTEAMQKLALEDAKNSVGASSVSGKERAALIEKQLKSVEPSKRFAALNTMNKVWENELDRIGSYLREKDPNWSNWGDSFDTKLLDGYRAGINLYV